MSLPLLKINSHPLHFLAGLSIQQSYEAVGGGSSVLRLGTGAAIKQQVWRKNETTISGSGRMPPALNQIDWSAPVTIDCVALQAVQGATTSITLPAARRSDAGPFGFAVLADGKLQKTTISVTGNAATLGAVAGAVAYAVHYYPVMTCVCQGPTQRTDATGTAVSWSLTAEEV